MLVTVPEETPVNELIQTAYSLEDEVGSLRWGKTADFTVLEADPYDVGVEGLRDIPIWGTVFEGEKFPIVPVA